jgi:hypothetical protein
MDHPAWTADVNTFIRTRRSSQHAQELLLELRHELVTALALEELQLLDAVFEFVS